MSDIKKILLPYQKRFETELKASLSRFGADSPLRNACEYALEKGKRFRPALVLMVSNALSAQHSVMEAALAVEFFHTASLIADDLPCMDNDDERRDHPSLHKAFGETKALLVSYALIAAGYECLARNTRELEKSSIPNAEKIGILALENASFNTGILGATGGQYLDLFPPNLSLEILQETVLKKTVTLFEVSMVLGWLFGGGNLTKLPLVKEAAYHYGMAFQIADDFSDYMEDEKGERKVNTVSLLGFVKASELFHQEIEDYFAIIEKIGIDTEELKTIGQYLLAQVEARLTS